MTHRESIQHRATEWNVRKRMLPWAVGLTALAFAAMFLPSTQADGLTEPLVVHEWGTFTELQSDDGTAIGGINTDDEPVPEFVHTIHPKLLAPTFQMMPDFSFLSKGIPMNHSQVTMRMETPVLYFYLPETAKRPLQADVRVSFRGGWISEYYPAADVSAPGLKKMDLAPSAVGQLEWNELLIGAEGSIPETEDPVWVTPRLDMPARVVTTEGEAEDYLFYRGVGNCSGPLRVITDREQNTLRIEARDAQVAKEFTAMWLIEVRPNGELAYRQIPMNAPTAPKAAVAQVDRGFTDTAFAAENRGTLHHEMHSQLCHAGLYPDEASAMLRTWDDAYFQSPGLRLFYIVPRSWTDERLPLTISPTHVSLPVQVERVMMGRIELVSDRQRALIQELKQTPSGDPKWTQEIPNSAARDKFFRGQSDFGDLGVEMPDYFQTYLAIGRFRNALLRHELATAPTAELAEFAANHGVVPGTFTNVVKGAAK